MFYEFRNDKIYKNKTLVLLRMLFHLTDLER